MRSIFVTLLLAGASACCVAVTTEIVFYVDVPLAVGEVFCLASVLLAAAAVLNLLAAKSRKVR